MDIPITGKGFRCCKNLMGCNRVESGFIRNRHGTLWSAFPAAAQNVERGRPAQFAQLCVACHGEAATGTERGPALVDNRSLRSRSEKQIHDAIQNGRPGMPAFALPEEQLQSLARWVRSLNASAYDLGTPGDTAAGERFFFGKGRRPCHMVRGGRGHGPISPASDAS
jgi:mono/diheme cytochrome c family protein